MGFLPAWWNKGSWTSFMVPDSEPVKTSRQKTFFWLALGVTQCHFCHLLLVILGCPRFNVREVCTRAGMQGSMVN